MCDTLLAELSKVYDDEDGDFRLRPLMRFHGRASFVRCLANVINLICKDILTQPGVGSVKEAKATLDQASASRITVKGGNSYGLQGHNLRNVLVE
jgi:hypothetical protein